MSKSKPNAQLHLQTTVYHLPPEEAGRTLAAALKTQAVDVSWGQVKKWIANRHVQVNGNLCLDEARRVSGGDVIKLWPQPQAKPVEARDLRLAHLDEHLLVVEKPPGITSVRHFAERKISTRRRQLQPTLDELLPPVLARILKLRWPPLPPVGMNRGRRQTNLKQGTRNSAIHNAKKLPPELQVFPVHRLDRDTSGLMLFARTRVAEQKLAVMFRRHTVNREYVAYCAGEPEAQSIVSHFVRDRGDGIRGSVPDGQAGQGSEAALRATTHITHSQRVGTAADGQAYSRVRCKLETGRTHQIRIHLSEAGTPICGDKIYFRMADGSVLKDKSSAPRQALHSDLLEFTHPFTGEHLQFKMALPKDLTSWLKLLLPSQP